MAHYCNVMYTSWLLWTPMQKFTANRNTLHCTELNYTSLHCTALNPNVLYCTEPKCTALHCTALQWTAPEQFCTIWEIVTSRPWAKMGQYTVHSLQCIVHSIEYTAESTHCSRLPNSKWRGVSLEDKGCSSKSAAFSVRSSNQRWGG